jgi:hypothetical protein
MKGVVSTAVVLTMVLAAVPSIAQSRPNFTGKWTYVPGPNAAPAGPGSLRQDFTVTQNDKTLTTTSDNPERPDLNAVYNLDGTETRSSITVNGRSIERVSKARWDGSKLVITSTTTLGGSNPYDATQTWSLDASGNLIIEGSSNMGGTAITAKTTFKKG